MATEDVDLILDHRFNGTTKACEYLVQWTSDLKQNWEPCGNLTECEQLLSSYWRQRIEQDGTGTVYLKPEPNPAYVEHRESVKERKQPSVSRKPRPSAVAMSMVDKMGTAKRMQQRKRLGSTLARQREASAAVTAIGSFKAGLSGVTGYIKPPPHRAKRSVVSSDAMDVDDDDGVSAAPKPSPSISVSTTDTCSEDGALEPPKRQVKQKARKSTGGRRLML
ncbi:hypothetical protein EV175_006813 [Coemansia sp. RSA 1933]|nr:hypothetical protein EV175_006813 [Coemansia sp. RSA 1933]